MPPHIPQSRKQLGYPLYAADFDPLNPDFLLVGGGGGSSATGVPNKISLLDVSRPQETAEISDIELAKDEDSVTTLSVTSSSETSLTALAGINSSVADQEAGKNEHLRSFRISLPPARKRKADGSQVSDEKPPSQLLPPKALSKTALFASARGPRNETYQRVLRSAPIQSAHESHLTAIASGLAPENEVIAFQSVSNAVTSTVDEISRIKLGKTEAADVDLIAVKGDGHVLAYCTDDSVYVQRLPVDKGSSESNVPVKAYQSPTATDLKQRPKLRALRFLTPQHILLLQNRPGRTGASLLILKINKAGQNGHLTLIKHLHQSIKLATGLDTAILRSPASEDFQAVIAVASQDSSIDLLTIDYTPSAGLSTFRHYALLRDVHSGPLTRLVFSNFIPPGPSASSDPKNSNSYLSPRIKLASVGLDKVVVVHTLSLRRSSPASSSDQASRFVLVKSGGSEALQNTISAFTAIVVVLLVALLTQAFYEIRGTVPQRLGVAQYIPANILDGIGQPAIAPSAAVASPSSPFSEAPLSSSTSDQAITPLVDIVSDIASEPSAPKVIVVRDTGDDLFAHVHDHDGIALPVSEEVQQEVEVEVEVEVEGDGVDPDTATAAEQGASTEPNGGESLKRWDELSVKEQKRWKEKLKSTGYWAEQHGESVLRGILFSELAGVVGHAFQN